jgi:hypothetical protein
MTAALDDASGTKNEGVTVSLQTLSDLTGFPLETIQQELFQGENEAKLDQIDLSVLREKMLSLIDSTMLNKEAES